MGIYLIIFCIRCDCFHFKSIGDDFYKVWNKKISGHFVVDICLLNSFFGLFTCFRRCIFVGLFEELLFTKR